MLLDETDRKIVQLNAEAETLNRLLSAKIQDYDHLELKLNDMDGKANLVIAETEQLNELLGQKTRELERISSLLTERDQEIDQLRLRLGNAECDSYSKAELEHRFNALLHDNNHLQGEFNTKIQ